MPGVMACVPTNGDERRPLFQLLYRVRGCKYFRMRKGLKCEVRLVGERMQKQREVVSLLVRKMVIFLVEVGLPIEAAIQEYFYLALR